MTFETTDLTPRIGTMIKTDAPTLLSGERADDIRSLLEQRGVLAFPQINLSDEEQILFTKTLGEIVDEGDNFVQKVTMDKESNPVADYLKGGFYWHLDGTGTDTPILASIMSARVLSETGGDTEFCNTYAAYDDLDDDDKAELEDARVVHLMESSQRYWNPEPSWADMQRWQKSKAHTLPLVWKHRSGRKSLILGCTASHLEDTDLRDGWATLVRLRDWATQPQYTYRHKWTVGDMVMWDNTGTLHRAHAYPMDSGRMMHRTKLQGEESVA